MNIIKIDDVIEFLKVQESGIQIGFPFDGSLNGNPNEILTKILFINYRESTRIKNVDVLKLSEHIESVLKTDDYEIICRGELGDKYYDIVNRIAFGHGKLQKNITLHLFHPNFVEVTIHPLLSGIILCLNGL